MYTSVPNMQIRKGGVRHLTYSEDDFWRPVMPRTDHRRMVFVIKRGRPKVDKVDMRTQEYSSELRAPRVQRAAARYVPIVCECLVVVIEQKDILRLEVGVDEVQVVEERYRTQQLPREGLNVRAREWYKAAILQEVEDTEAK